MIDEPDIVKQLREAERLGMLQSKVQSTYEKLQVLEKPPEDVPDEMSGVCERDVEKKRTTFYFTLKNSIEKNKKILYNN